MNAKDKSTHTGFKIKAESAMRQLEVLDALTDGPPTRAMVIRDHPELDPAVAEQAAELSTILKRVRQEYDEINKDAYGYVIEMCDLDHNPSLLAKIKPISKTADGRKAWNAMMDSISTGYTVPWQSLGGYGQWQTDRGA